MQESVYIITYLKTSVPFFHPLPSLQLPYDVLCIPFQSELDFLSR